MCSVCGADQSLKAWLDYGTKYLQARQIADAKTDAWLLMEYVANITRNFYYIHMHETMNENDVADYLDLLSQRGKLVPVQYLTGEAWFYGYSFKVNQHVMIPRQDTEILVEEALKRIKSGMKILDLCTGSGCILLSILKEASVLGVGTDISQEALLVAELNRKRLGVHTSWIRSDLFENVEGRFHMILSNPPYIPSAVIPKLEPNVRRYEPLLALDGREDGLYFYKKIVDEARSHLSPGGWLCLEIGYDQKDCLKNMLKRYGYTKVKIIKDLAGNDRVVVGVLNVQKL